jgi:hypothetical protein
VWFEGNHSTLLSLSLSLSLSDDASVKQQYASLQKAMSMREFESLTLTALDGTKNVSVTQEFTNLRPAQEFLFDMETSQFSVKGCKLNLDLCSALRAFEQKGIFYRATPAMT